MHCIIEKRVYISLPFLKTTLLKPILYLSMPLLFLNNLNKVICILNINKLFKFKTHYE